MLSGDRNQELGLISGLCRELATLGLNVSMSDARPAVLLRFQVIDTPVEIALDGLGEYFERRDTADRFPAADPAAAARIILDQLTEVAAHAQVCMKQLIAALHGRGLQVVARYPRVTARNPAVIGQDALGEMLSPGLSQQVEIRPLEGRGLMWCWVWPGFRSAERDLPAPPPDVEPMCPAEEIDAAADRIANVVRLHDPDAAVGRGDV